MKLRTLVRHYGPVSITTYPDTELHTDESRLPRRRAWREITFGRFQLNRWSYMTVAGIGKKGAQTGDVGINERGKTLTCVSWDYDKRLTFRLNAKRVRGVYHL